MIVTKYNKPAWKINSHQIDDESDPDSRRILRHIELIDDEASEYGITIVKSTDKLMAKKYGYRKLPGLTYFRKGIFGAN